MNARRLTASTPRSQHGFDNGLTSAVGSGTATSPSSEKLGGSLIALARILARQAAADYLRDGSPIENPSNQGPSA